MRRKSVQAMALVLCLLLFSSCAGAAPFIDYDRDEWPLDILIEGQGTEIAFDAQSGRLTLPSMTLLYLESGNFSGWSGDGQIGEAEARALFSALAGAPVKSLSEKQYLKRDWDGAAWLSTVMRLTSNEMMCLTFYPCFNGVTAILLEPPKGTETTCFFTRSKALWENLNVLANWAPYDAALIKKAQRIRLYVYEYGLRGTLLGEINAPRTARRIGSAIAKGKGMLHKCPVRYEMAFELKDGKSHSAYMLDPGCNKKVTILAGNRVSNVKRSVLEPVLGLIPET